MEVKVQVQHSRESPYISPDGQLIPKLKPLTAAVSKIHAVFIYIFIYNEKYTEYMYIVLCNARQKCKCQCSRVNSRQVKSTQTWYSASGSLLNSVTFVLVCVVPGWGSAGFRGIRMSELLWSVITCIGLHVDTLGRLPTTTLKTRQFQPQSVWMWLFPVEAITAFQFLVLAI